MSLGKAIEYDAWQEFEQNGGTEYTVWLTIETLMSLADLFNGFKGAATFLKSWKQAGKLAKLQKAVEGKKLTRKSLLKIIKDIDSGFDANLAAKGAGYVSKKELVIAGQKVLAENAFISLGNQQARVLVDAIGNALTLVGAPDNFSSAKKTYDIWVVHYGEESKLQ